MGQGPREIQGKEQESMQTTDTGKILAEFSRIKQQQRVLEGRIASKATELEGAEGQEAVERALGYTNETILKGLADLQLSFGSQIETLVHRLAEDGDKLAEVQRAITAETDRIRGLQAIETAAEALHLLKQEQADNLRAFEETSNANAEEYNNETVTIRTAWSFEDKSRSEATLRMTERIQADRARAEADFRFETEKKRRITLDTFESDKKLRLRAMDDENVLRTAGWDAREAILKSQEDKATAWKTALDLFPASLEADVKKAREEAIRDTMADAKVRADLLARETDDNRRVSVLRIESLNADLAMRTSELEALQVKLAAATKQTEDLAKKVLDVGSRKMEGVN